MSVPSSVSIRSRRAGLLWLLATLTGGSALMYVRGHVYVPGDAAATANADPPWPALRKSGFSRERFANHRSRRRRHQGAAPTRRPTISSRPCHR